MRHIFIINPASGRNRKRKALKAQIIKTAENLNLCAEIYETRSRGDGENYVKEQCRQRTAGERLRFYACGGDGSLNEVVNGAVNQSDVEVGCIPMGTGNDYVRNFPEAGDFSDIAAQMRGKPVSGDLIRYTEAGISRYCINMFNIGFDCNVAVQTDQIKKFPLIRGSLAYLISVFLVLIQKKGADLIIEYEEGPAHDGELLLVALANGCFCGGGVKGIPRAVVDDGLMDVSLIHDVSRRTFVRLFPKYAKGTHLEEPGIDRILDYRKCRKVTIHPNRGQMNLCVDGEVKSAGTVEFEIVPQCIRFVVPDQEISAF